MWIPEIAEQAEATGGFVEGAGLAEIGV